MKTVFLTFSHPFVIKAPRKAHLVVITASSELIDLIRRSPSCFSMATLSQQKGKDNGEEGKSRLWNCDGQHNRPPASWCLGWFMRHQPLFSAATASHCIFCWQSRHILQKSSGPFFVFVFCLLVGAHSLFFSFFAQKKTTFFDCVVDCTLLRLEYEKKCTLCFSEIPLKCFLCHAYKSN